MPSIQEVNDARAAMKKLQDEEFARKMAENAKGLEYYTKRLKELEQVEKSLHKVRMAGVAAAVVAYARLTRSIQSLRQAGLENTVEANRQHTVYQLLGREIAGIFMPATTASTNAMLAGAKAMTGLNEKGQNFAFVLSTAVTGLVALKAAQLAAAAAGIKLSGVAGSIVANLGKIGLIGGIIGGLAALFLASNDGAKTLEDTMKSLVTLANELGDALDDALKNPGKFWDDVRLGMAKKLEDWGILGPGAARKFFDQVNVPNAKGRGGLDERRAKDKNNRNQPTPGNFQFENVGDAYERVQIAAAKNSMLNKDAEIPKKQLEEQEKIRQGIEELVKQKDWQALTKKLFKLE